ncbi:hypothetical protein CP985_00450, partial [Malaciobacter mytili LMG 24559]
NRNGRNEVKPWRLKEAFIALKPEWSERSEAMEAERSVYSFETIFDILYLEAIKHRNNYLKF